MLADLVIDALQLTTLLSVIRFSQLSPMRPIAVVQLTVAQAQSGHSPVDQTGARFGGGERRAALKLAKCKRTSATAWFADVRDLNGAAG
jgi:hypothetical protein